MWGGYVGDHVLLAPREVVPAEEPSERVFEMTPAEYEELIRLRTREAMLEEMVILRERKRTLESEVEIAYDLLDTERKHHGETKEKLEATRVNRDNWMVGERECRREIQDERGRFRGEAARADRMRTLAIVSAAGSASVLMGAAFGRQILETLGLL